MKQLNASANTRHRSRRVKLRARETLWLTAICVGSFGVLGCEGGPTTNRVGDTTGAASIPTHNEILFDQVQSFDCKIAKVVPSTEGMQIIFSDDKTLPLWGNATDDTAPCIVAIPMQIPVGKMFAPLTLRIRGAAIGAHLSSYYYWKPGLVTERPPTGHGMQGAYFFQRDLPGGGPTDALSPFDWGESLSGLNSPTCDGSQLVTFVISLQRSLYRTGNILSVDSIDFNFEALDTCGGSPDTRPPADHAEKCGRINEAYVSCKAADNVCVTSYEEQPLPNPAVISNPENLERGTCVDPSKDKPANLYSGFGDKCAGPFRQRCQSTKTQELVCTFKYTHAAESTDHYWGKCLEPLSQGATCNKGLVRDCNDYECSLHPNPCKSGLECLNNVCAKPKGVRTKSADGDDDADGAAPASDDVAIPSSSQPAAPDPAAGDPAFKAASTPPAPDVKDSSEHDGKAVLGAGDDTPASGQRDEPDAGNTTEVDGDSPSDDVAGDGSDGNWQ